MHVYIFCTRTEANGAYRECFVCSKRLRTYLSLNRPRSYLSLNRNRYDKQTQMMRKCTL